MSKLVPTTYKKKNSFESLKIINKRTNTNQETCRAINLIKSIDEKSNVDLDNFQNVIKRVERCLKLNLEIKDQNLKEYTDLNSIKKEVEDSRNLFKKNNWPIIDVTRRSVEETAASILKIIEIKKNR